MKESVLRHLQICKHCGHAFQPGIEGENNECDVCVDSKSETPEDRSNLLGEQHERSGLE